MKLRKKCSGECPVCLFRRTECNPEDGRNRFTRANKDELLCRLNDDLYTDIEKNAIKVWLKVQH